MVVDDDIVVAVEMDMDVPVVVDVVEPVEAEVVVVVEEVDSVLVLVDDDVHDSHNSTHCAYTAGIRLQSVRFVVLHQAGSDNPLQGGIVVVVVVVSVLVVGMHEPHMRGHRLRA